MYQQCQNNNGLGRSQEPTEEEVEVVGEEGVVEEAAVDEEENQALK